MQQVKAERQHWHDEFEAEPKKAAAGGEKTLAFCPQG